MVFLGGILLVLIVFATKKRGFESVCEMNGYWEWLDVKKGVI